jgi:hypothetical protein
MMEELNLLKKLGRVNAPSDFEQKVMAQLSLRKRKAQRVRYLRLSLAGALSAALVFFVVLNFFILPSKSPEEFAEKERAVPAAFQRELGKGLDIRQRSVVPVIETVDYTGDIRTRSQEPPTVYLLEQVSDKTNRRIKY